MAVKIEDLVEAISRKLRQEDQVYTEWAPTLLRAELDRWFWRDGASSIQLKDLWDALCRYTYLPRLSSLTVLHETVAKGVHQGDFALADREELMTGNGAGEFAESESLAVRFVNLRYLTMLDVGRESLSDSAVLVHADAASRQLERERQIAEAARTGEEDAMQDGRRESQGEAAIIQICASGGSISGGIATGHVSTGAAQREELVKVVPRPTRFVSVVDLDNMRVGRDAARIAEEIIQHLTVIPGAKVRVTLDIEAEVSDGIQDQVERVLRENGRTLGFRANVVE